MQHNWNDNSSINHNKKYKLARYVYSLKNEKGRVKLTMSILWNTRTQCRDSWTPDSLKRKFTKIQYKPSTKWWDFWQYALWVYLPNITTQALIVLDIFDKNRSGGQVRGGGSHVWGFFSVCPLILLTKYNHMQKTSWAPMFWPLFPI